MPGANSKNMCKGCGFDFGPNNTLSRKKVWRCKSCNDFLVCSNCKLCKNGHQMFKCYSLVHKGSGGYKSNSYGCDFCSASNKIKEDNPIGNFVWHCNVCEYDVCPSHFLETTLLFQQEDMRAALPKVAQVAKPQPKVAQATAPLPVQLDHFDAVPMQATYSAVLQEDLDDDQHGGFFD